MRTIQMVQQMSGRRADGRDWPPVGGEIDVDDEEARALTHTASQQSHPIAVYVSDPRREERAVADEKAEHGDAVPVKTVRAQRPEPRPARAVSAEKRG